MSYRVDENGNYKRTVRCGYCYELGHNKGSCQAKKQNHLDYIATYEKEIADDNFVDDWERDHVKRKLNRHKAELNKTTNRGKNRKCSYCKDEGHTRRTCSFRKGDMNDWVGNCLAAREKFVENMTAAGFGVGALGYRSDTWTDAKELVLVESVNWSSITQNTAVGKDSQYQEVCYGRSLDKRDTYHPNGRLWTLMLPTAVSNINNEEVAPRFARRCLEIISPSPASPPKDFLTVESAMKAAKISEIFEDSRPYHYHGIVYDE